MPSSFSSVETNSEVESLKDMFENEEVRYVKKGYGLISASVMTYLFFFQLPDIIKIYYHYLPIHNLFLMYAGGSILMHEVMMFISNIVMYAIYKVELPFFERYRISSEPWPWKTNPKEFNSKLISTFVTLFWNSIVIMPLITFLSAYCDIVELRIDALSFPSCIEIALQITFFMIVEDSTFYWAHRFLHTPFLYKHLHKKHHEFNVTIGIAAEYAHPLEFIFSNIVPTGLGAAILGSRCHIITWFM